MKEKGKAGKVKEDKSFGEKGNERRREKGEEESGGRGVKGRERGGGGGNKEPFHPSSGSLDRWILAIYQQLLTPLIPLV